MICSLLMSQTTPETVAQSGSGTKRGLVLEATVDAGADWKHFYDKRV